jgi:hypothetical protein
VDWEQWLTELRGLADNVVADEDYETVELPEAAWEVIDRSTDLRMRRKLLRQARKRVTRGQFPSFVRMILEYGSGRFTGYYVDPVTDSKEETQQLIERAVGLHSPQAARLIRETPGFHEEIEAVFRVMSEFLGAARPQQGLTAATDADLIAMRDHLQAFQRWLEQLVSVVGAFFGQGIIKGLSAGAASLREASAQDQAAFVLIWLLLHQAAPEMRSELRQVLPEPLPSLLLLEATAEPSTSTPEHATADEADQDG